MRSVVAFQKTLPRKSAQVLKIESSQIIRENRSQAKIDEMAVIDGIALGCADAVGIVADSAGRFLINNMLVMFAKAFIA